MCKKILPAKAKCPPNTATEKQKCYLKLFKMISCVFRPTYPEEELDEENIIEDDSELNLNKVEEEMMMEVLINTCTK